MRILSIEELAAFIFKGNNPTTVLLLYFVFLALKDLTMYEEIFLTTHLFLFFALHQKDDEM